MRALVYYNDRVFSYKAQALGSIPSTKKKERKIMTIFPSASLNTMQSHHFNNTGKSQVVEWQ